MTDDDMRGWVKVSSGKVRDIYAPVGQEVPDRLLLVTGRDDDADPRAAGRLGGQELRGGPLRPMPHGGDVVVLHDRQA